MGLRTMTANNEFYLGNNPPSDQVAGKFKNAIIQNQKYVKDLTGYNTEAILTEERYNALISNKLPPEIKKSFIKQEPMKVPRWRMVKFEDDVNSAINPAYLMNKLKKGTLTTANVQDFAQMNPYLYSNMALELIEDWKNGNLLKRLTYSQKIALERFLQTTDIVNLRGGVFNVNEEASEPIKALERNVYQPQEYLKGTLDKQSRKNQVSSSQRFESL